MSEKPTPKWEADGFRVIFDKTPGGVVNEHGQRSYSMRIPVLEVTEWVKDREGVAAEVAKDLNEVPAKDAEIARLNVVVSKYREAQDAAWRPIATCPIRESVDLWCVYGGEEFAQFDGGASIGKLVSNRHKTVEYGFFGNQSNDGVPQRDAPDLVPVAWRPSVPSCPASLIAEALNLPLTYEEAIAKEKSDA